MRAEIPPPPVCISPMHWFRWLASATLAVLIALMATAWDPTPTTAQNRDLDGDLAAGDSAREPGADNDNVARPSESSAAATGRKVGRRGAGLGVQYLGNGQYAVRTPIKKPLPVAPGADGEALVHAVWNWIASEPAKFAGVEATQLQQRRLHPIPLHGGEPGMWWAVEFHQVIDGLVLEDSILQVAVVDRAANPTCEAAVIIGRVFPKISAVQRSRFSRDEAWQRVRRSVNLPGDALHITGEWRGARVIAGQAIPVTHFECGFLGKDFVVNEVTGAVMPESMEYHNEAITVQGTINHINHDPNTLETNVPMPDVRVDYASGSTFTDDSGQASFPTGESATVRLIGKHSHIVRMDGGAQQEAILGSSGTVNFADTNEFPYAENLAYYHTTLVHKWLSTRIDTAVTDSFFDTFVMETQVNFNSSGNANFSSAGGTLHGGTKPRVRYFRANGTFRSTAMSDVIYHEYGHYADWAMGGLFATGGLSEAWGDIVAAFIHADPEIAEGFRQNDDPVNGTGIRSVQNNYIWNPNDEIHLAGTAFGGFAWDIRSGFIAAQAANNWNQALAPIPKAEAIVFSALDGNTTSIPDSVLYIQIFDGQNGGDSITQGIIAQAATNHGLETYLAPDLRITAMTADAGFVVAGAVTTVNVAVTVENLSDASIVIDVALSGTQPAVPSQSTANLAPFASATLDFVWDTSAASAGRYVVTATASSASSNETDTDSVMVAVASTTATMAFFDDFESGTGKWNLQAPWGLEAKHAKSPTMALSDSPGANYANDLTASATSIPFSLVGVRGAILSLWQTAEIEADFDNGTIEMSADGTNWMILDHVTGIRDQWHAAYDASYFDGRDNVRVRFRLVTDPGLRMDGWFIDDVRVVGETDTGWLAQPEINVAFDDFESADFSGGTGWSGPWTVTGNATNATNGPYAGTRHVRFTGAAAPASRGRIERFANVAGITDLRVQVFIVTWFEETDSIVVSLSDDGGANWTEWKRLTNAYNGNASQYRLMDVALADLGLSATNAVGIRIHADNCNGTGDIIYADNVRFYRPNYNPVLAPIGNQTATEGQPFGPLALSATDPDAGQTLAFSAQNLPAWAILTDNGNGTASISGTPDFDAQGTVAVTVWVHDNGPGSAADFETFDLHVVNVNRAPTIAVPGAQSATEGVVLTFTVGGTDPDLDPLSFSSPNLPAGATLDSISGAFEWTPDFTADQSSPYVVTFVVDDGFGGSDSATVTIAVANVNDPPRFPAVSPLDAPVRKLTQVNVMPTDNDNDPFTLELVSALPPNAEFDAATGEFSISPASDQLDAVYVVTFSADDGICGPVTFDLEVRVTKSRGGCGVMVGRPDAFSSVVSLPLLVVWLIVVMLGCRRCRRPTIRATTP